MTLANFGHIEEIEKLKYANVDDKIKAKMNEMIKAAIMDNREIDWEKFKEYCYEYFYIPKCLIDRCFNEVKDDNNNTIQDA